MKNVFFGLLSAATLSAGLVAVEAPAQAADLSRCSLRAITGTSRWCARALPRLGRRIRRNPWTDRCFWWAYHWQDYRHYRSYARTARYSDVVSYRN